MTMNTKVPTSFYVMRVLAPIKGRNFTTIMKLLNERYGDRRRGRKFNPNTIRRVLGELQRKGLVAGDYRLDKRTNKLLPLEYVNVAV